MKWEELQDQDVIYMSYIDKYKQRVIRQGIVVRVCEIALDVKCSFSSWTYFLERKKFSTFDEQHKPKLLEVYRFNEEKDIFKCIYKPKEEKEK